MRGENAVDFEAWRKLSNELGFDISLSKALLWLLKQKLEGKNDVTPEEVRAMFDSLSDLEKAKTGLIVNPKKNKSWTPIREAVKAYALEKKSFSLLEELKEAGIIDEKVTAPDFRKNAVEKIDILYEQKSFEEESIAIPYSRSFDEYHLRESSTFVEPSREAANIHS